MIRRPPRSTRTDTLLPYTTLFRSDGIGGAEDLQALVGDLANDPDAEARAGERLPPHDRLGQPELEADRSEEHTSELQSLMRISYAVFCLKKKKINEYYTKVNMQHKETQVSSAHTHFSSLKVN